VIARPREEVFAYLADLANHPEFCDHYLVDWHMTREDTIGRGAGARFRVKAPLNRFAGADVTVVESVAPRRIVEAGRTGKFNRLRTLGVYELETAASDTTRVTFTLEARGELPTARIMAGFGARGWMKRKTARALRRLRSILEDGSERGQRATIAAG